MFRVVMLKPENNRSMLSSSTFLKEMHQNETKSKQ